MIGRGETIDRMLTSLRLGVDALINPDGESLTLAPVAEPPAETVAAPTVSRPNVIAVMSPKGGVGKTTCAFLAGDVLAGRMNLRVLAIDAGPEVGTLNALVPHAARCERSLDELLVDAPRISNAAQLRPYVSCLASGMHVLAPPQEAIRATLMTPDLYDGLVDFVSVFYDVVVLDVGSGVLGAHAQFAVRRADELAVVTTPESVTAGFVAGALARLPLDRTTLVVNMAQPGTTWDHTAIALGFRRDHGVQDAVLMPFDEELLGGLDGGNYALDALCGATRAAVCRLGTALARRLV